MSKCKVCGTRLAEGMMKCPVCGAVAGSTVPGKISPTAGLQRKTCPFCGKTALGEHNYCPNCEASLKDAARGVEEFSDWDMEPQDATKQEAVITDVAQKDQPDSNSFSPENSKVVSPKSRLIAALLAFFLGWCGAHRIYAGKIRTAVAQLFLTFVVIGIFWWLIDFFRILCGKFKDSKALPILEWFPTSEKQAGNSSSPITPNAENGDQENAAPSIAKKIGFWCFLYLIPFMILMGMLFSEVPSKTLWWICTPWLVLIVPEELFYEEKKKVPRVLCIIHGLLIVVSLISILCSVATR